MDVWLVKVPSTGSQVTTEDEFDAHQVAEKISGRGPAAEVWRLKDGVWKMFDVYPK